MNHVMKKSTAVMCAALAAVSLVGCGGSSGAAAPAATTAAPTTAAATTAAPTTAAAETKAAEAKTEAAKAEETTAVAGAETAKGKGVGHLSDIKVPANPDEPYDKKPGTGRNFALIAGSAEMPFTQVLIDGAQHMLRDGDTMTVYFCDWDASKEIQQVEDICANGVDAIMMDPADPDAVLPAIQTAIDAGIPLISYDCSTNYPDMVTAQIASDDVEAGYLIAKNLFEEMDGKGKIQSYVTNTTKNSQNRLIGLQMALEEYPDIEWLYNCEEKFDPESAVRVFESMLMSHPDTDAFFCANENIVKAAVTVLDSNGLKGEKLLGNVGAGTMIKDFLNDGQIYCSYDSQPYVMGGLTVEITYDILDNGTKYDANDPVFVPGQIRKKGDDYYAGVVQ